MLIRVIYKDKTVGTVKAERLEVYINSGDILAFRRLDGWVKVGHDAIRGYGGKYSGEDRRNRQQGWLE